MSAIQTQQAINTKTPLMILQEYTVKNKVAPPEYDLIHSKTGTHENEFHFQVSVGNVAAIGMGRSKQVAKHDAAFKAITKLTQLGLIDTETTPIKDFNAQLHRNEPDDPFQPAVNCKGTLLELCNEHKIPPPFFTEVSDVGPPHDRKFTYRCQLASLTTIATANTKKQAQQLSAKSMLERVREILPDLVEETENARNAIEAADEKAKRKYEELSHFNVIPNKSARVIDFPRVFVNLMEEKSLTLKDFIPLLNLRTEDGLKKIFGTLDLEYEIVPLQESPVALVALNVSTDTPFCIVGKGDNIDLAENDSIKTTFEALEDYMGAVKAEP